MSDRIIDARDLAKRDGFASVADWFRVTSIQLKMKGRAPVIFDGTVSGRPVYALISNGRCLALCDFPHCDGCEYVDPESKIFFCIACGNNGTGKARPVIFPRDYDQICEALLERRVMPMTAGDEIVQAMNSIPLVPGLRRDWVPTQLSKHPGLRGRVAVQEYGESPEALRRRTKELNFETT